MSLIISSKKGFGSNLAVDYMSYPMHDSSKFSDSLNSYEVETIAYRTNIESIGGSIDTSTLIIVNDFVKGMKSSGLWSKMYEIYPFLGNSLNSALVKLKTVGTVSFTASNNNFVEADYQERGSSGGLKGDGSTKWLETGLNLGTLPNLDNSLSVYCNFTGGGSEIGQEVINRFVIRTNNGGFFQAGNNVGATFNRSNSSTGNGLGFYVGCRPDSATQVSSWNGDYQTTSSVIAGMSNDTVVLLARRDAPSSISQFSASRVCFFHMGLSLSAAELITFYTLVNDMQTSLGRNA